MGDEMYDSWIAEYYVTKDEYAKLEADNAKLREALEANLEFHAGFPFHKDDRVTIFTREASRIAHLETEEALSSTNAPTENVAATYARKH